MQRSAVLLALVLLVCLCFCLPLSADEAQIAAVRLERGVDPQEKIDGYIAFDADRNRWRGPDGALLDRTPAGYDGMTLYTLPSYLLENIDFAYVDFDTPLDLSRHQTLRLICQGYADGRVEGAQLMSITLSAGEEKLAATATITVNDWCAVVIDIGSWSARDRVDRIEIQYTGSADLQFIHMQIDEEMDAGLQTRFLTDSFTARGGKVFLSPHAEMGYFAVTDNSPMLTASVLVPARQTATNALRFVFDNETACRSITLQYAYSPDGVNARSLTQAVGDGRQICLFEVPDADRIRYVRIIFTGAGEGLITLRALNAVSVYENTIEHLGTITECVIAENGREINVRGTVAHDIMITNRNHHLALFAVQPWETVDEVLSDGRAPHAIADISIRFSFTLPFAEGDYAALGAGYLVAIRRGSEEEGYTYTPLSAPRSLTVPAAEPEEEDSHAIKGVQTSLVSSAVQAGASIYLVDVELDRLCSGNTTGYRYSGGGENLFFDHDVLDALDEAIRLRSAAGEKVYLRLSLSTEETAVSFAIPPEDSNPGTVRGILLDSAAARDTVGAIAEFLTRRYAGGQAGRIAGFIIGRKVDDAAAYNDIGICSLSDYADHYADLVTLIANTVRRYNPALAVIVPISDRRPAECITADLTENSYDSELFLRAFFRRLDTLSGPTVSLMLESAHNPFSLMDGVFLPEENDMEESPDDEHVPDYYNADALGDFSSLVDSMSAIYSSMPDHFLYCWTPAENTGDALSAAYAYLYYRLRFSTHASAFIVSLDAAEAAGDRQGMLQLKHLMRYIDTERSLEVSETALTVFGLDSWRTLIADFDADALADRALIEGELLPASDTTKGTYPYWDFSAAHSTRGWYSGTHMGSLAVRGSGAARCLEAEIVRTAAETGAYSEIVYRFSAPEPLSLFDRLAFSLCIKGSGAWEVSITAGFEGHAQLEQKYVVEAGRQLTLCLTPALSSDAQAEYLKISVKPVSGNGEGKLCLYSVAGESDSLGDDALAAAVKEQRSLIEQNNTETIPTSRLAWVFGCCAVVIFTMAVAVILGRRQDEEMEETRH